MQNIKTINAPPQKNARPNSNAKSIANFKNKKFCNIQKLKARSRASHKIPCIRNECPKTAVSVGKQRVADAESKDLNRACAPF